MLSRLALLGATKGPCVSCRGIRRPHLKVTGLPDGALLTAITNHGVGIEIIANGIHPIGHVELEWIEVSCSVSNRNTIVEVISTKAA